MSINMNALPTTKPSMSNVIPKGQYLATIEEAKMVPPKSGGKPYFSAQCDIVEPISKSNMGKFWINLFDSEAQLCQWQIGRFITALKLNLTGEFELKDLTKFVKGKSLLVDICPEERKDGQQPQRSIVDISADCYYPVGTENSMETATDEIAEVFAAPIDNIEPTITAQY